MHDNNMRMKHGGGSYAYQTMINHNTSYSDSFPDDVIWLKITQSSLGVIDVIEVFPVSGAVTRRVLFTDLFFI